MLLSPPSVAPAAAPAPAEVPGIPAGPASALIGHILATHHVRARELLENIEARLPGTLAAGLDRDPRLAQVQELALGLKEEMLLHMGREERVLFPLIQELESLPEVSEADTGALLSPVVCMKREHGFIDDLLAELRRLTDDYTPPAGAGPDQVALLRDLAAFEADTREHVRRENEELFPLAMELAPPVR